MTDAAITTADIIFIIAVLSALGGMWVRIERAISAAKAEALKEASDAAELASSTASQLSAHKLHVAETYITKAGMREQTEQIMGAIGDMKSSVAGAIGEVKTSMAGLNQRIDRVIEDRPHRPPRPVRER